ncbi:MAG TPA: hypothetical protein VLM85_03140 [Polyangiaceae bacterium]|nr:hypothetical protein [Polyangiaceae bacterium]
MRARQGDLQWGMRVAIATLVLACGGCFDAEHEEFIPVRVPVCSEAVAEVTTGGAAAPSTGDVTNGPSATPGDPCDTPPPTITTCTGVGYVRVGPIRTEPNCYLDVRIRAGEVGRLMLCPSGVMVVFEGATFVGDSADGYVNVCQSTTYDFPQGDDCTWRTEQRIQGSLSGPLSFSYVEGPVAGASCTLACRAHAPLEIIR